MKAETDEREAIQRAENQKNKHLLEYIWSNTEDTDDRDVDDNSDGDNEGDDDMEVSDNEDDEQQFKHSRLNLYIK